MIKPKVNFLYYEGTLKLCSECDCGRKYATPANKLHPATVEEVKAWLAEREPEPQKEQK